jgi:hypothetical protein
MNFSCSLNLNISQPFLGTCALLLFYLTSFSAVFGQEGGIAGGERHTVRLDEENRPFTAGGFKEGAPVVFQDITEATGLNSFRHSAGYPEKRYIIGAKSGGVGIFDYNQDGWLDIYLLNGSPFEALLGKAPHGISRLYRNDGDGRFTDVTEKSGVPNHQWAFGVTAADYDGDGWLDFFVSNFGANRLYHNNGDGTFTDVAEKAGVTLAQTMTTGAAFGDYNHDGKLDLFVSGYANFNPNSPPQPGVDIPVNYCQFRGQPVMCGPRGLPGTRDFLFKNNGDGTFTEVAEQAGVDDKPGYYGFSPVWIDVNDDGWIDLTVANDSTPNYLYINNHDDTFRDISYISGFALNQDGRAQAGMGLAVGDYNLDGLVDFCVGHFSDDYNTLYRNQGDEFFIDVTYEAGLGDDPIPFVTWGSAFLDFDNDGLQDLFFANGHVYPIVDDFNWGTTWKQRPLLFKNLNGKRFEAVPAAPGSGLAVLITARGAAFGDLDNDGREDVVINCIDSPPKILRNVAESKNNWLTVQLTGGTKNPPQGLGATLFLESNGKRQRRDIYTGGSFASHSDQRAHFGIGEAEKVERLEVRWPSGGIQVINDLPVNKFIEVEEGKQQFKILEGHQGWRSEGL